MSGDGISLNAVAGAVWTGAFTTGTLGILEGAEGWFGPWISLNAEAGAVWITGALTTGVLDTLAGAAGWLGPCISKSALLPEEVDEELEKDTGLETVLEEEEVIGRVKVWVGNTRGARGRLGLRKLGSLKPLNGFVNLNCASATAIIAIAKMTTNFILDRFYQVTNKYNNK